MAPGRFHNSLLLGHKYSVCINSLLTPHITPSLHGKAVNQPSLTPSLHLITAPPLYPITAPSLHPITAPAVSWRAVDTSKASTTSPSKAKPFCKLTYKMFSHSLEGTGTNVPNPDGQRHLSQDRRFSPGVPLSLAISYGKDIIRGANISAGFQPGFPSCHLVDKGDISPFLFHRRWRSTWESSFSVGNLAQHHPI